MAALNNLKGIPMRKGHTEKKRMSSRNAQIARICVILDLLEQGASGFSAAEIAKRIETKGHHATKRTVYRDLEAEFNILPARSTSADNSVFETYTQAGVSANFVLTGGAVHAL